MSYTEFFKSVCGHEPFPYQIQFHETEADFKVLRVPTGLGKTDAVLVDWLHRRPTKRFIYVLPGRALTRQIAGVARMRAKNRGVDVVELMGGSEDLDLRLTPDKPAILVGTQDILISRALNRGYARSPSRWPIDFALLNNDATWVFDEVQLLGDALATSTQLAAFRKRFGTFGVTPSIWMSATFDEQWLKTVDFNEQPALIGLTHADLKIKTVVERLNAPKTIEETKQCTLPKDCAQFVAEHHTPGTLTLVIANTVGRAQEIWDEVVKAGFNQAALLHSRFRPCDREGIVEQILASTDGIVISTQVVEAGVDIDANLMITDVAPWPSLVQRFGRVNRRGHSSNARIFWVRSPQRQKGKVKSDGSEYAPYDAGQVHQAIKALEEMRSAAPSDLEKHLDHPAPYRFVLRSSDLIDLFDTTADLAGNQIDVSRFVRSGEETNVYVAWRRWPEKEEPPRNRLLQEEMCSVPHFAGGNGELAALLKRSPGWTWDFTGRGKWVRITDSRKMFAGMRILLRAEVGGYDEQRGWAPEVKVPVGVKNHLPDGEEDADASDARSEIVRQTLSEHTDDVARELEAILAGAELNLDGERISLELAARYHDWGKAHPVFQQTLHDLPETPIVAPEQILAKQERGLSRKEGHSRNHFRHELASALALLQKGDSLAAYIAAAHHGKVRLNIRSMPGEVILKTPDKQIARGIEDGDLLFAADLGQGFKTEQVELDLSPMRLGLTSDGRGWSDQMLDLLNKYGPFRLAFLEMLLRVADESASAKASSGVLNGD